MADHLDCIVDNHQVYSCVEDNKMKRGRGGGEGEGEEREGLAKGGRGERRISSKTATPVEVIALHKILFVCMMPSARILPNITIRKVWGGREKEGEREGGREGEQYQWLARHPQ